MEPLAPVTVAELSVNTNPVSSAALDRVDPALASSVRSPLINACIEREVSRKVGILEEDYSRQLKSLTTTFERDFGEYVAENERLQMELAIKADHIRDLKRRISQAESSPEVLEVRDDHERRRGRELTIQANIPPSQRHLDCGPATHLPLTAYGEHLPLSPASSHSLPLDQSLQANEISSIYSSGFSSAASLRQRKAPIVRCSFGAAAASPLSPNNESLPFCEIRTPDSVNDVDLKRGSQCSCQGWSQKLRADSRLKRIIVEKDREIEILLDALTRHRKEYRDLRIQFDQPRSEVSYQKHQQEQPSDPITPTAIIPAQAQTQKNSMLGNNANTGRALSQRSEPPAYLPADYDRKVSQLEKRLNGSRRAVDKLRDENIQLQQECQGLQLEDERLLAEKNNYQAQAQRQVRQIQDLNEKVQSLTAAKEDLERGMADLETEIRRCRAYRFEVERP